MTTINLQQPVISARTSSSDPKIKNWKDVGYRGYSAFLASDDDFMIYRRFGTLNARLLLRLQDQIAELEERLEALEKEHAGPTAPDTNNGTFRNDPLLERKAILDEMNSRVREYNELLIQNSTLRDQPAVAQRHVESLNIWHENVPYAVDDAEKKYLDQPHDLIRVVPKSVAPVRRLLEKSSRFRLSKLWALENPPLPQHSVHPEEIHYSSDAKIDNAVGVTITMLGMIMLIAPLWILNETSGPRARLAIITGFIVIFLGLIAFTTVAKPFESLAAAAAYSAVLVVFLQTGTGT
ncbi:hypothetical protein EKO04_007093 [Ascochyta lentis]|uniref:DUF6594 domain-containing protein n=1 Tax=Ascochyta lentis TaxID=205686 RepID=A0A8H7J2P7_9PLEO|nr:hypothetical protein EKO04_007093 [Ascochyta lentis]